MDTYLGHAKRFEQALAADGTLVLKFWLHIGADDYRNRARRKDYVTAVNEMIARTGTKVAPRHLIPANDKRYARVAVLRTLCSAAQGALTGRTRCAIDLSPRRGYGSVPEP